MRGMGVDVAREEPKQYPKGKIAVVTGPNLTEMCTASCVRQASWCPGRPRWDGADPDGVRADPDGCWK